MLSLHNYKFLGEGGNSEDKSQSGCAKLSRYLLVRCTYLRDDIDIPYAGKAYLD